MYHIHLHLHIYFIFVSCHTSLLVCLDLCGARQDRSDAADDEPHDDEHRHE